MAERQQNYPDSTGARWDGAPGVRRPAASERPAFLDRTEPMSQQDRATAAADGSLNSLMATGDQTNRLPARGPNESEATAMGTPRRRHEGPSAQWSLDPAAEPGYGGDPELAAASGFDGHRAAPANNSGHLESTLPQQRPATPPPMAPVSPPQAPQLVSAPPAPQGVSAPPAAMPAPQAPGGFDEPTQLHNPVSPQAMPGTDGRYAEPPAQQRRTYPESVGEGVYRRNRPGLGLILAVVTIAMVGVVGFMLISALADGRPFNASALVSGTFALAGLPLTAWGLYPLLGAGPNTGPDDFRALLRPPYTYLLTGIALLVAAGLAA